MPEAAAMDSDTETSFQFQTERVIGLSFYQYPAWALMFLPPSPAAPTPDTGCLCPKVYFSTYLKKNTMRHKSIPFRKGTFQRGLWWSVIKQCKLKKNRHHHQITDRHVNQT